MSAKNIDDQDFENQSTEGSDSSYDEPYEDDTAYSEDDSDEWSEDVDLSEGGDAEDAPAPAKKKTSNLMIGIILFVAIIGVFGFMVLGGNKNPAPQTPTETPAAINAEAESDNADTQDGHQPPQADITDLKNQADQGTQGDQSTSIKEPVSPLVAAAPQQGLMDNPDLLNQNSNAAPVSAEPAPLLTGEPAPTISAPDAQSAPQAKDVVAAIAPSVKPVSDFPTVDSIKKPDAVKPAEPLSAPVMTAVDPVPSASIPVQKNDASAQLQAQVTAAQDKITVLQKQLADQAAELAAQKQKAASAGAAAASTPTSSEAEVDELKAKISDLEAKLAAKPAKLVTSERNVTVDEPDNSVDEVSAAPAKKTVAAAAKPKVVAKQWSLKSAGTGKAILSDKATGDLKTVHVGDSVPGLGRIVSISSNNSAWVVKGTMGSVSE